MPNLSQFMDSSSKKLATIKRRARATYLPKRTKVNKNKSEIKPKRSKRTKGTKRVGAKVKKSRNTRKSHNNRNTRNCNKNTNKSLKSIISNLFK